MKLTKEQMFDFILTHRVTLIPDGKVWHFYNEDSVEIDKRPLKYTVSIDGLGLSGYDLEEAIQYYADNEEAFNE